MTTRTYVAAVFAVLMNLTVFTAGALVVLAAPYSGGEVAAYLLPAATAISLFISPLAGWAIAPWFLSPPKVRSRSRYAVMR